MTQMLECLDKLCVLEVGSTPALKLTWISGRQFIMHVHFKIFMLNIYTINIDIALVGKLASRLWSYPSVEHFLKKIRNDCWLFWFAILPTLRCQTTFHIQNAHILNNISPGDVRQPQHQHQLLPLHRRGRGHGLAAAPPPPGPPGDLALRHGELSLVEGWSRDLVTGSDWSRWAATSTTCSTAGWTVSSGSRPSINKIEIIIVVDKWIIDIYSWKDLCTCYQIFS